MITVVIMLILAGVAIGAIANGDGLFEKTKEASEMYEQSSQNENEKIQELMNEIDKYFSKSMDKENPVIIEAIITLTFSGSSHSCMVKVYDMAENCIDSNTITVTKHVHTDACYNWTTKIGHVRWVNGPGSMTGDYTVECNLCGSSWTDWEGWSIVDEHCTQKVRGSLICGK